MKTVPGDKIFESDLKLLVAAELEFADGSHEGGCFVPQQEDLTVEDDDVRLKKASFKNRERAEEKKTLRIEFHLGLIRRKRSVRWQHLSQMIFMIFRISLF